MSSKINPPRSDGKRESGAMLRQRFRRHGLAVMVISLVAALLAGLIGQRIISQNRLADLNQQARDILLLQAGTLNSILEKPRLLPALLAQDTAFQSLFLPDVPQAVRQAGLDKARGIASLAAVRDILFLDPSGRVFGSVTGEMYEMRPFKPAFDAAMQSRLGRLFFENGIDTPFYVFAAPVRKDSTIIGAIIVEVYLNEVLAAWALVREPVLVTDIGGRILLTNRPEWGDITLQAGNKSQEINGIDYLERTRFLPLLGWTLHSFVPLEPARKAALLAGIIAGFVPLFLGVIAWLMLRRAQDSALRQRRERAEAIRLERQVRDRTADLRAAQARLVQSAKLAAIGQLSATLAHEYNQPLAAIQAHAANARTFLARGDGAKADKGLGAIAAMVTRMDALSRTLLSFARKPGTELRVVSLSQCLGEAITLVAPTARNAHIEVTLEGDFDLDVLGGQVRFVQVFVNLLKNSIDALGELPKDAPKWVRVTRVGLDAKSVTLTFTDNGPGVPPKVAQHMFDPFFTTKGVGQGLGIGLSIVYNILEDAGAMIDYRANEPQGACFTLTLQRAGAKGQ